mgnify:CR=1 FL=1
MDKLSALNMFVVTAELGSFSRAAEQLGKTPSALTKAVGHLEDELGARLFEAISDPRARLKALFQLVAHELKPHIIYSELLKALDHPSVQPVIDRVSKRRLDYLAASFRQTGLVREDALHRARLTYAAYVGFLQLNLQLHQARMPQEEFDAYVEHLTATLVPV